MKLIRIMVAASLLLSFVPAHAGKMVKASGPLVVDPDRATIVFMRPGKMLGRAIAVPVWDVTGDETRFVGIVDAGGKVAYSVPSGEHVFMTTVVGGDAGVRFQKAHVETGKIYHFRAHIIDGIWGLHPVRGAELEGAEFRGWDKKTKLLANSPRTIAWGESTLGDAMRKRGLMPEVISDEFTLRIDDGR
jgi:hypothetical protein